jgi:hypothetical protein
MHSLHRFPQHPPITGSFAARRMFAQLVSLGVVHVVCHCVARKKSRNAPRSASLQGRPLSRSARSQRALHSRQRFARHSLLPREWLLAPHERSHRRSRSQPGPPRIHSGLEQKLQRTLLLHALSARSFFASFHLRNPRLARRHAGVCRRTCRPRRQVGGTSANALVNVCRASGAGALWYAYVPFKFMREVPVRPRSVCRWKRRDE